MTIIDDLPPRLGPADAVKYLYKRHGIPTTVGSLKQWAWKGGGPNFQKAGAYRLYPVRELDLWAMRRLSRIVQTTGQLERKP